MTETYVAIVTPTPWTWDGLTPLTECEQANRTTVRSHSRRDSFTGHITLVLTDRSDWVPGDEDPERITVQAWSRDECVDALRREVTARGLTGTLEVIHECRVEK